MTWLGWTLVATNAIGALLNIACVGKERKPLSGRTTAGMVALNAAVIVGILTVGTGHL